MPSSTWTVEKGDTIWDIAAQNLSTPDRTPALGEIVVEMERIIALNLDTLKKSPGKGNPNLIFPGMTLALTSVPSPGEAIEGGKKSANPEGEGVAPGANIAPGESSKGGSTRKSPFPEGEGVAPGTNIAPGGGSSKGQQRVDDGATVVPGSGKASGGNKNGNQQQGQEGNFFDKAIGVVSRVPAFSQMFDSPSNRAAMRMAPAVIEALPGPYIGPTRAAAEALGRYGRSEALVQGYEPPAASAPPAGVRPTTGSRPSTSRPSQGQQGNFFDRALGAASRVPAFGTVLDSPVNRAAMRAAPTVVRALPGPYVGPTRAGAEALGRYGRGAPPAPRTPNPGGR